HPLERAGGAEETCQEPRAARVRDETDADECRDERRRLGRDPQVARAREREAGAGRGAVDGGDDGLLEGPDREDVRVVALAEAVADGHRSELAEILADAEAAARARDHDRADLGVPSLAQA